MGLGLSGALALCPAAAAQNETPLFKHADASIQALNARLDVETPNGAGFPAAGNGFGCGTLRAMWNEAGMGDSAPVSSRFFSRVNRLRNAQHPLTAPS